MTSRERFLRLGGGLLFAALAFLNIGGLAPLWNVLALILVMTAAAGCCMVYRLLGRTSCPAPRQRRT